MEMNKASSDYSAYSSIITLPPGSTGSDLQIAINSAAAGSVIVISGDMQLNERVTIPDNLPVTIRSDAGNNWTITQDYISQDQELFYVLGSLTLEDITLDGGEYSRGVSLNGGALYLYSGSMITKCLSMYGGGVYGSNRSTLIVDGGNVYDNVARGAGAGVFLTGNSQMYMYDGRIRGNIAQEDYGAGVVISRHSSFDMTGGSIEQNSAFTVGGGIFISGDSVLHMDNGYVSGNASVVGGTGIFFEGGADDSPPVNELNNSGINYNTSGYYGAGMYVGPKAIVNIKDTSFRDNHAERRGGGCYLAKGAKVTMIHCQVDRNLVQYRGGGIYVEESDVPAALSLLGGTSVTYNYSHAGSGGIYTERNYDYINILTDEETVFLGNTADTAIEPPPDAYNRFPNIRFSEVSVFDNPINNYDINPLGDGPLFADVRYLANGGTGSYTDMLIPIGTEYVILSAEQTGISRSGYSFGGWNTQADAMGTMYQPGERITITGNIELYAVWTLIPEETVNVIYHANGGIGSYLDGNIPKNSQYTFLSLNQTGISRPGYNFDGWNTQADAMGTMYQPGDRITVTGDMELYAIWSIPSEPDCCTCKPICCYPCCDYYESCGEYLQRPHPCQYGGQARFR